jgi:uroporphyrinogen-III decarboxylase
MNRDFYLELAGQGLRMPIGTDLLLHEQPDPEACRLDGDALGAVVVGCAERFRTPLAFPLMDLEIEKEWLVRGLGVPAAQAGTYHFSSGLSEAGLAAAEAGLGGPTPRMKASLGSLDYVRRTSSAVPIGMCIGPFSLMTKLLADPITSVYMVALDPDDDDARSTLNTLELATRLIVRWVVAQLEAGAKAICVCEPACSSAYISPNQLAAHPGVLDTLVLTFHRRMRQVLADHDADLILHDCGQLTDDFVSSFKELDPAILSLGSPCDLPSMAHLVGPRTVMFGNLPSKKFYSDREMTVDEVRTAAATLNERMKATAHPFVLGSECDVLSVPGHEAEIMSKVMAMLDA